MANKEILNLTEDTSPVAADVVETQKSGGGAGSSRRVTLANLGKGVKLDDLAVPDDNTDLDATGSLHGLLPKADKAKLDGIEAGATADQTAGEIKTAYESNADTNPFTDAEQTKLSGIEASADVTDAANVTAAGAHMAGGTDVPVADGGTGASDAATARTNLDAAKADLVGSPVEIGIAVSDETTALTTGIVATFRMPFAMTLAEIRAGVTTAPTGSTLIIDTKEEGTTLFSTKLSVDAAEKTSTTAAVPAVISDPALADDAEITFIIDQIGSTVAGAGLKVYLIGTRA